ncbi:MAG: LD-carboxypeptidase, partial [Firmicutes bacterium]|nr:LD-carboxypeptidase [Bacillota bacterium]
MKLPKRIQKGDKVCAISLSSGLAEKFPQRYQIGKQQIQEVFDIEIVESKHALKSSEWLANNPQARADDLMEACCNSQIKAIFSIIGGNDSIKIVPFLDKNIIRNNPKIFVGNSDSTVTHFLFNSLGVQSYYATSIMTGFAENGGMFEYTKKSIEDVLFVRENCKTQIVKSSGFFVDQFLDWGVACNQCIRREVYQSNWNVLQGSGIVDGELFGGCVEVVDELKYTELMPKLDFWSGKLLFLEISETMPPVEWFKTFVRYLGNSGILQRIKA